MTVERLKLSLLMLDGGTHGRAKLDFRYVAALAEAIRRGEPLAPVVVFFDGAKYWLADGFHRARATADAGQRVIAAEVRAGDRRAALLFGLTAAAEADAHRTRLDKRRAVALLLADSEWAAWSNQAIAERLRVSLPLVAGLRRQPGAGAAPAQAPPPQPLAAEEPDGLDALSSAERCILIDPYLATPEVIGKAIEALKAHYRRKTGKPYP